MAQTGHLCESGVKKCPSPYIITICHLSYFYSHQLGARISLQGLLLGSELDHPGATLSRTDNVSLMLVVGSPLTAAGQCARAPTAMRPRSLSPKRRAGVDVAARSASIGVNPAATIS